MADIKRQIKSGGAAAFAAALLCGCSGWESFDYHETSNIPEGPGLISGEKGGWTIFRIEEKKKKPKSEPKPGKTDEQAALDQMSN